MTCSKESKTKLLLRRKYIHLRLPYQLVFYFDKKFWNFQAFTFIVPQKGLQQAPFITESEREKSLKSVWIPLQTLI
jgi:hypothetical protein